MYNYMRRCLIIVIKAHKNVSMRSVYDRVVSPEVSCVNVRRISNDVVCKRLYCQVPIREEDNQSNVNTPNNGAQQKLDEFLSDPENKKAFQVLELELDVLRHDAERIPENLGPNEWLQLVKLSTKSQKRKYLAYLWRNEISDKNRKAKRDMRKAERLSEKAKVESEEDTGAMKYGLAYNSLFLRIYPTTMNHYYNCKVIQSILYEPKVVFDCGYENHMSSMENHNCAKQLTLAFASNRTHTSPMCLYFCSLDKDGALMRNFQRNMPNIQDVDFPAFVTSQSYLDLFPRDKLIYLTPHCKTDIIEYDPEMTYIIGAMVDKSNQAPLSAIRAKKEGIRMAKFPIEKYLDWGSGSTKNLTLDQVLNILLDIKHTKDWKTALQHVPTRKLREAREYLLQKKLGTMLSSETRKTQKSFCPTDLTFSTRRKN